MAPKNWQSDALCSQIGTEMFFADTAGGQAAAGYRAAKQVCRLCPVMRECRLMGAAEGYGVWGGMAPVERRELRRGLDHYGAWDDCLDLLRERIYRAWEATGTVDGVLQLIPELDTVWLRESCQSEAVSA